MTTPPTAPGNRGNWRTQMSKTWTVYSTQDRTDWFVVPEAEATFVRSYGADDQEYTKDGTVEADTEAEALDLGGHRYCGVEPLGASHA